MNWREVREELLADPEVRKEYEALGPEYELALQIIKLRRQLGLSQSELDESA